MTRLLMTASRWRVLRYLRDHPSDVSTLRLSLHLYAADALRYVQAFQAHGLAELREGVWHLTTAGRDLIDSHDNALTLWRAV